jgi:hypothetical protein
MIFGSNKSPIPRRSLVKQNDVNDIEKPSKNIEKNIHKASIIQKTKGFFYRNAISRPLVLVVSFIILILIIFGFTQYKIKSFKINHLEYADSQKISNDISGYLSQTSFFGMSSGDLADIIKSQNSLVRTVTVNKSLFAGIVVDIEEFQPIAILKFPDNKEYFFTLDKSIIPYQEGVKNVRTLGFENTYDELKINENISNFIEKSIKFIDFLNNKNFVGVYSFDNYGNLSILSTENKLIKADVRERYFTIDEQIKVFQNALVNNVINSSTKEIDLRFTYLIIK